MTSMTLTSAKRIALLAEQASEAIRACAHYQLAALHERHGERSLANHFRLSAKHIAHRLGGQALLLDLPIPVAIATYPVLADAFRFGIEDTRPNDLCLYLP